MQDEYSGKLKELEDKLENKIKNELANKKPLWKLFFSNPLEVIYMIKDVLLGKKLGIEPEIQKQKIEYKPLTMEKRLEELEDLIYPYFLRLSRKYKQVEHSLQERDIQINIRVGSLLDFIDDYKRHFENYKEIDILVKKELSNLSERINEIYEIKRNLEKEIEEFADNIKKKVSCAGEKPPENPKEKKKSQIVFPNIKPTAVPIPEKED